MAVAADQVTVEVLAKLDGAKRDVVQYADGFERNMKRVEASSNRGERAIVQSSNRQRAALQQVGIQFGDFTTQLSLGANVFQAFGAQAGQAAGALVNFGGTVGRVAGFLAGPAGSLLIALTAVAGMMLTASDNTDKAATAKRKHGEAARTLAEAIDDLNKVTGAGAVTERTEINQRVAKTKVLLGEAIARRANTVAIIEELKAINLPRSPRGEGLNPGAEQLRQGLIGKFEGELAKAKKDLADAQKAFNSADFKLTSLDVADSFDPMLAAMKRYESAEEQVRAAREAGIITSEEARSELRKYRGDLVAAQEAAGNVRKAESAQRKAERDAAREAEAAERAYWQTVKAGNAALDDAAEAGQKLLDERLRQAAELRDKVSPSVEQQAKDLMGAGDRTFDERMSRVADSIQAAQAASYDLKADLADAFGDAVTGADNFGDAMVRAFERAAAAAVASRVFDFLSTGSIGDLFAKAGNVIANRPAKARASGGHVSAGQLYRVNEGGVEGFQPAGSGKIIPLGQMAARPAGGVTVMQPLNVSFAGAITTPELMAEFKAYADGVGQAAIIGGKGAALTALSKKRRQQL